MKSVIAKTGTFHRAFYHVLFWGLFITYEVGYIYVAVNPVLARFWDYGLHYFINISLFYCTVYGLNLVADHAKHVLVLAILYICAELMIDVLLLQRLVFEFLKLIHVYNKQEAYNFKLYTIESLYRAIYFLGFAILYWFIQRSAIQRKKIYELEYERLRQQAIVVDLEKNIMQVKNAHLQSQLNPHLLFNTLNFIYYSVKKVSDTASQAILLLAEMMRYSLSEGPADGLASVQGEVKHINNLILLNKLRFGGNLHLKTDIRIEANGQRIIPLLLISFVENQFKHGDLSDPAMPGELTLNCTAGALTLKCSNKKNRIKYKDSWGIGVNNTKSRLEMHYPGSYTLNIAETEIMYSVELIIRF